MFEIAEQGDDHRMRSISTTDSAELGQNRIQVQKRLCGMLSCPVAYEKWILLTPRVERYNIKLAFEI